MFYLPERALYFWGKDMIICPNCRAKLGDGSSSCVVCGASLGGGSTAPKAPEPAQAAAPTIATAPAVAATAPMEPALPKVQIDLAARPMEDRPLPRNDLIEEAKPAAPAQAQQPQKPAPGQLPPQAPPPPAGPSVPGLRYARGRPPQSDPHSQPAKPRSLSVTLVANF